MADAKHLQASEVRGIENYAYTTNSRGEKDLYFEIGWSHKEMLASWMIKRTKFAGGALSGLLRCQRWSVSNTRRTILSPEKSSLHQGEYASSLGSSPYLLSLYLANRLSIRSLTTTWTRPEKKCLLSQLVACDGGTGVMQESFHVDDNTLLSWMVLLGQHGVLWVWYWITWIYVKEYFRSIDSRKEYKFTFKTLKIKI